MSKIQNKPEKSSTDGFFRSGYFFGNTLDFEF